MGADLIGYFAKGPRNPRPGKLPEHIIAAAIAEADRRINWLRRAQQVINTDGNAALIELIPDCPWIDPKASSSSSNVDESNIDFEQLRFDIEQLISIAGDVDDITGKEAVDRFTKSWPPQFRDAAHITDPDDPEKVIVFAGERTWGDTPDGCGFKLLARAGVLGIASELGIWIESAFMTLRFSTTAKENNHE